jgi:hypothetical protein
MLQVLCVRTGEKYSIDYVLRLRNMVSRHLSLPYEFCCLTDNVINEVNCRHTPYKGWWGKISLFENVGPVLYFDLDTVILKSLDPLASVVMKQNRVLLMLKPFNVRLLGKEWLSGVMAWNGDWKFISDCYNPRIRKKFRGDQNFITDVLHRNRTKNVLAVQDVFPGVYSYKRNIRDNGNLPTNATIVCFHGNPRPSDVNDKWVKENWL